MLKWGYLLKFFKGVGKVPELSVFVTYPKEWTALEQFCKLHHQLNLFTYEAESKGSKLRCRIDLPVGTQVTEIKDPHTWFFQLPDGFVFALKVGHNVPERLTPEEFERLDLRKAHWQSYDEWVGKVFGEADLKGD